MPALTGEFAQSDSIANVIFEALEGSDEKDSITGQPRRSIINMTASETSSNYKFESVSTTLWGTAFTLDVDGDGDVTALGDGLMIIRKLFGAAFSGTSLTANAVSDDATHSTTEVHAFIQQGIDSQLLDVDRDGEVTALGDCLMIIRQLFGSAFSGSALTDNAISAESPYFGQPDAWNQVAANIDALRPDT